jgi:hypothetical protein
LKRNLSSGKTSGFEIEDNSKILKSSNNTLYTCKIGEGRKEHENT